MDDFLEARAAKIETAGGSDSTTIGLDCLKGDFDAVFALFLDLLHNPDFAPTKSISPSSRCTPAISRRNDNVDSIVGRESRHPRLWQRQSLRARVGICHCRRRSRATIW